MLSISCAECFVIPPVTGRLVECSRYRSTSRAAWRPSLMPLGQLLVSKCGYEVSLFGELTKQ